MLLINYLQICNFNYHKNTSTIEVQAKNYNLINMKNEKTSFEEYKSVKDYTQKIFVGNDEKMVSLKLQEEEIRKIEIGLRHEQFYFIVDIINFKIIRAKGMETMGYSSDTFDMMNYVQSIPSKGIIQLMILMFKNIIEFNIEDKRLLQFMKPKFISQIPMRDAGGSIKLVKRTISPFQYNNEGQIIEYISEYVVVKNKFDNDPPEPRFSDVPSDLQEKFDLLISNAFTKDHSPFSPKLLEVIKMYAKAKPDDLIDKIAQKLKIKVSTLQYYNKEIMIKAKEFLGEYYNFATAKEVAIFLKKCGILQ